MRANSMVPLTPSFTLPAGQVFITRGNPILYEVDRPTACGTLAYDLTGTRYATGNTAQRRDDTAGSCGGGGAPDRLHVYRLPAAQTGQLEIRVRGHDFAPAVHVRYGDCGNAAAEQACDTGAIDTGVILRLDQASPGPWFIAVDGRRRSLS